MLRRTLICGAPRRALRVAGRSAARIASVADETVRGLHQPTQIGRVQRSLQQRFVVPFAAGGVQQVAAIDMQRACQPGQRIGEGVDDVASIGWASPAEIDLAPAASISPPSAVGMRRQNTLSSRPV